MPQVPIQRTPVTPEQAQALFRSAWHDRFATTIDPAVEALLLALWDLETATGQKEFNWNFGNIVTINPDETPFWLAEGDAHHYHAYDGPEQGAAAFVAQLTRESRQHWWDGLLTGDPEEFVRALNGQNGPPAYFEAPFQTYLRGFLSRWRKYAIPKAAPPQRGQPIPAQPPAPTTTTTTPPSGLPLVVLGSGLLAFLFWRWARTARR